MRTEIEMAARGMVDQLQTEESRIARLRQFGILDTPTDHMFNVLTEQALVLLPGCQIAAISLVDVERQWFKSIIGLNMKETPRSVSFCSHTIQTPNIMVVEDATSDERFAHNPLVTSQPNIRFYAGIKLLDSVGALCVISNRPRKISKEETANLVKLAGYVDIQLLVHGTRFNLATETEETVRRARLEPPKESITLTHFNGQR